MTRAECDWCGYYTDLQEYPGRFPKPTEPVSLCSFCANTIAAEDAGRGAEAYFTTRLARHCCALANAIVDALGGDRSKMFPDEPPPPEEPAP